MANDIIRPSELPARASPAPSEVVPSDNGSSVAGVTWADGVNAAVPPASEVESVAGVINTKRMTPLTTKQAIDAQVPPKINTAISSLNLGTASQYNASDFASAAQGAKADTSLQSLSAGANTIVDNSDPRNPIVSSTGGVADGDKGDVTVSSSGAVWGINDEAVTDAKVFSPVAPADGIKATKIAFLQAGTGAQHRSVESKLRDTVSVKDFGAKGDGATDDTAAFNAALAFLLINNDFRGGKLYIPKGSYKLSATINIDTYTNVHGLEIVGDGVMSTVLDFSAAPAGRDGVAFTGGGSHFGIRDLFIFAAPRDGLSLVGAASHTSFGYARNLRIQGCGRHGVYCADSFMLTLSDIWSRNNANTGFAFAGFHTSLSVDKCEASGHTTNAGFSINGVVYSTFKNCGSDDNRYGYSISNVRGVSLVNCGAESNGRDSILIRTSDAISAGVLPEAQNVNLAIEGFFAFKGSLDAPGSYSTFLTMSTLDSRPIQISLRDCISVRANVADYAVIATASSGTISVLEEMSAFDGTWSTSGTVRRNIQTGSSVALGAFSSTGATQGKSIDLATINHSNTGTGNAFNEAFYNANGLVGSISSSGTSTAFNTTSDERMKEFLGEFPAERAIEIIRADPVREFTWKADGQAGVGWGAQTSYAVSPDLATPGEGEPGQEGFKPWGVDQSKRTPYLWAAVSYLINEVDRLKTSEKLRLSNVDDDTAD